MVRSSGSAGSLAQLPPVPENGQLPPAASQPLPPASSALAELAARVSALESATVAGPLPALRGPSGVAARAGAGTSSAQRQSEEAARAELRRLSLDVARAQQQHEQRHLSRHSVDGVSACSPASQRAPALAGSLPPFPLLLFSILGPMCCGP